MRVFNKKIPSTSLVTYLLLTLSSCQLGPSYHTPAVEAPDHWKTQDAGNQSLFPNTWKTNLDECAPKECPENEKVKTICNNPLQEPIENWWEIFNDPTLNQLEEQAVASNYSLWSAIERVEEARAQARVVGAKRWPNITFDPTFFRTGALIENPLTNNLNAGQLAGGTINTQVQNAVPRLTRTRLTAYALPLNFTYEVDLWSRIRNMYEASVLRAEVAQKAYENVLLTLTTDVAYHYFLLRGLDLQHVILKKNIQSRLESYEITLARFEAGIVVYVDVTRAQEQLAAARAERVDVERQRANQENILAVLTGNPAPLFSTGFNPLEQIPPTIPMGLPSELLYRRPDVLEAERNLAATFRDIGVAYSDFYPSVYLLTTLGLESPDLSFLFDWKARLWAVGVGAIQTVFNAGRNSANLRDYLARYREAYDNYLEIILIGFMEVEDSLINIKQRAIQAKDVDEAVKASQETLDLSKIRYRQGLVNYLDVSEAERDVLLNERNAGSILTERFLASVLLIKALGGGWEPIDEETKACLQTCD